MKTYSGKITKLESNQIFVFGSNPEGRHGKGAARWAREHAGAVWGKAEGIQNQSYGIITKDLRSFIIPSISKHNIIKSIANLYRYAFVHTKKEFLIGYSHPSLLLCGYTTEQMAQMFVGAIKLTQLMPKNIVFEEGFATLVEAYMQVLL